MHAGESEGGGFRGISAGTMNLLQIGPVRDLFLARETFFKLDGERDDSHDTVGRAPSWIACDCKPVTAGRQSIAVSVDPRIGFLDGCSVRNRPMPSVIEESKPVGA